MKICFASNNLNKIKELNQLVAGHHIIVGLTELGLTEDIAETGSTFEENSRIKAQYVFDRYEIPVFADDSGLCVAALNGDPGVYSARYAGQDKNDEKNIDLLLQNLYGVENRNAKFVTVITYIDQDGSEQQFRGEIQGRIIEARKGSNGFGYDPVFVPAGYEKSFAEISAEAKNKISHRALAVQQLVDYLKNGG